MPAARKVHGNTTKLPAAALRGSMGCHALPALAECPLLCRVEVADSTLARSHSLQPWRGGPALRSQERDSEERRRGWCSRRLQTEQRRGAASQGDEGALAMQLPTQCTVH